MIGQQKLINKIDKLVANGFPRFVLLVGAKGSGKKLISREIANKLSFPLVPIGIGVDEVREVITNSYRNVEPIVYILPDTDKMSVAAKNALLKVTEEPPQKAYFILTVTDLSNTLKTLISRACVLQMDNYSEDELRQYLGQKYDISNLSNQDIDFLVSCGTVPEEIDVLMSYDVTEFRNFVEMVSKHLHTVSSANAFKIEQKLALKKDEEKWDVLLFLQALKKYLCDIYLEFGEKPYFEAYKLACSVINELKFKNSANRQYCLDSFILEMRKCWREQ